MAWTNELADIVDMLDDMGGVSTLRSKKQAHAGDAHEPPLAAHRWI